MISIPLIRLICYTPKITKYTPVCDAFTRTREVIRAKQTHRQFFLVTRNVEIQIDSVDFWPVLWVSSLSSAAPSSLSPRGEWALRSRSGGGHCELAVPVPSSCCPASATWPACSETKPGKQKWGWISVSFTKVLEKSVDRLNQSL